MAQTKKSLPRVKRLDYGTLIPQIEINITSMGDVAPSLRVDTSPQRREAVKLPPETSLDTYSIKLTAEEIVAAKIALSDPQRLLALHEEGRRRYDERWGLDPQSPTRIEAISVRKAP